MSVHVEDIELRTCDGIRLVGDVYHPLCAPRGGVVVVHGFTATRRLDAVAQHVRALADAGYMVLAYDARGHGMSEGECTLGHLEAHDVGAAVAYLRSTVDQVVAVGASMGAVAVLSHAVSESELAGIVLVSLPSSFRSVLTPAGAAAVLLTRTPAGRAYTRRLTGARVSAKWHGRELPTSQIGRLLMPVAIVHGRKDGMIRASAATEVYRAASEPRRLDLVDGMGHAFQTAGVAVVTTSVEWVFEQSRVSEPS